MNYFKNISARFPKTKQEKTDLERLKSFVEHINNVLVVNRQKGIINSALVISEKQMQDAEKEIQAIKIKINKRRLRAMMNLDNEK